MIAFGIILVSMGIRLSMATWHLEGTDKAFALAASSAATIIGAFILQGALKRK
jgi:hypothetical protein